ncbi:MAG: RagB/SusD family nutrient uptake outer membrane protein [Rikenellaceae bacterium]|jgi:hypothetical protein|nr:RagB/SusD family nutrient uptake outer membrane protein [Rikenellaceae bacterium]
MNRFLNITVYALSIATMASCDSFLDQQPLNQPTTTEEIFSKKLSAERYLNNCYGFIPDYWLLSAAGGYPWSPTSDESDVSWPHEVNNMNNGSWNPGAVPYAQWRTTYQAIREVNYFLQNIYMCREISDAERDRWRAEARFLRAFYYLNIIRLYGPVVIVGDELYELDKVYAVGRNTLDDCAKYVCDEFDAVAAILPPTQSPNNFGRPTAGAALAFKAQLLNFVASPLFNSDNSIYRGWKSNVTGEELIAVSYDEQKWRDAAAAARAVIDLPEYALVVKYDASSSIDPYASLYGVHFDRWNTELIFGRNMPPSGTGEARNFIYRISPKCFTGSWGGLSVSQKQVDAFAMNNGRYPIAGYSDAASEWGDGKQPIIDPLSGYDETGVTANYIHPWDRQTIDTYNMYVNREPRFYVHIIYDNLKIPYAVDGSGVTTSTPTYTVNFGKDGNSNDGGTNRSLTGYTPRKFFARETNVAATNADQRYVFPVWPIIRLAEIYLDYVEALIEYDPTNSDVLVYWNMIRARAGVPNIEAVYPGIENDQAQLRKMLRRERQVELFFENSRYYDIRRWQIAEFTNNGPVYGMNITEADGSPSNIGVSAFWRRTPTIRGPRTFLPKHYLYPLAQRELDRNKLIEQSWGW